MKKYMEEAFTQKQARAVSNLKSLTGKEKVAILKFLEKKKLKKI